MPSENLEPNQPVSPEDEAAARRARKLLRWVVLFLVFVNVAIVVSMFLAP